MATGSFDHRYKLSRGCEPEVNFRWTVEENSVTRFEARVDPIRLTCQMAFCTAQCSNLRQLESENFGDTLLWWERHDSGFPEL